MPSAQAPTYPIEPDKLLDAANRLAPRKAPRGRPPYTAHRRATSTAYYAVFHAITTRVVEIVFPAADVAFRQQVRRWIAHSDIATVCRWVSILQGARRNGVAPHIKDLLAPHGGPSMIDADTVAIADGFLDLHEKRDEADYVHEAVFPRADTRGHIALATQLVKRIETSNSDKVKALFGLIAMQARVRGRTS